MVLSSLLGALFAVFISLFLLLRPSMLRDFEQGANRWVSLRRGLKPLEIGRAGVDEYVFKYGRQAGILLVLGSIYTLSLLTFWLGHYH
jgi:cell division protein FtsW (lipid II flippase)